MADVIAMLQMLGHWDDLFQLKFWVLFRTSSHSVRQMVFAYISIEGWIIHPDVNSFFYGSDEVLILSPHNAEVLDGGIMTCDVLMVIYWGGGLQMLLKPLTKSSG